MPDIVVPIPAIIMLLMNALCAHMSLKCYKKGSVYFCELSDVCFPPEHTTSSSVSKKPRLDQIPAANLDADDPLTDVCFVSSIDLHVIIFLCFLKCFFYFLTLRRSCIFFFTSWYSHVAMISLLSFMVDF